VGTDEAINEYLPQKDLPDTTHPPIYFTKISINGKADTRSTPYATSNGSLKLPYNSYIVNLRIFDGDHKVPNISVKDIDGDILAVSQFTLHASTKKGNRPSYIKASKAEIAIPLYEKFIIQLANDLGKIIFQESLALI
jgi:hypothetical protein